MSYRSLRRDNFLSWLYFLKWFVSLLGRTPSRIFSFQSRPVKPVDKLEKRPRENEMCLLSHFFLYNPSALVAFYSNNWTVAFKHCLLVLIGDFLKFKNELFPHDRMPYWWKIYKTQSSELNSLNNFALSKLGSSNIPCALISNYTVPGFIMAPKLWKTFTTISCCFVFVFIVRFVFGTTYVEKHFLQMIWLLNSLTEKAVLSKVFLERGYIPCGEIVDQ